MGCEFQCGASARTIWIRASALEWTCTGGNDRRACRDAAGIRTDGHAALGQRGGPAGLDDPSLAFDVKRAAISRRMAPDVPRVAESPFAEAEAWRSVGPEWRPLFGNFKDLGFSFE